MADTFTTNYALIKPDKSSLMSDFATYINPNWDKVSAVPAPDSVTGALPQTGSYQLGDRVYRTNDTSIYILIAKDADWGWFWRPVHAAISPWITVPSSANNLVASSWSFAVDASNPFAIALDNRGNCYWRGAVGVTSGVIAANTSHSLFKSVPIGLRPRENSMYTLGYFDFGAATSEGEMARVFIPETSSQATVRVQGVFATTNQISKVYLDGNVQYAIGTAHYGQP